MSVAGVPLLLAVALLGVPSRGVGALHRQVTSDGIDVDFQVESAIGEIPGHWSLASQGFRDQYLPDTGFGDGVFSVPLGAPAALGFDLDSVNCVPCALVDRPAHQLQRDSRHRNAYKCRPGLQGRRVFFMASAESVIGAEDPVWSEAMEPTPRFRVSGRRGEDLFFHEWITAKEIAPGKRLACGAWIEGEYPPKGEYIEVYEDTLALGEYVIRDRAIYLIGEGNEPEYLLRESNPIESNKCTFERAFLPARYSELETVTFSYVYRIQGGFWLRVNFSRSFEGAGADEGMFLLEFGSGKPQLLAGDTSVRMY